MPKKTAQRIIDRPKSSAGMGGAVLVGGSVGTVTAPHSHSFSALTGTATAAQVPWAAAETLTLTAGAGLTGGGTLEADRTFAVGAGTLITVGADTVGITDGTAYQFIGTGAGSAAAWQNLAGLAGNGLTHTSGVLAVGAGNGLTVNADDVALTTPGTLTVSTSNSASGSHTHAVTSSSDVSAGGTALLSSNAGALTVATLTAGTKVRTPLIDTASGALTLDAAGDEITIGASNNLRRTGYASQTTGWAIDYNGSADFRYLYADEMHVKSFIADLEQALAGGQIISKSVAVLAVDFTAPAASGTATLRVRDLPSAPNMAVFQANDIVRLRTFSRAAGSLTVADCWGVVTSYADQSDGTQTWTFTRSAGGNAGSMAAATVVAADALVLDYGTTGNGFHEVNAIDGAYGVNSPYSQVVTWTTHPATGQTVRTRTGNLLGLWTNGGYGFYAGDGTADSNTFIRLTSGSVGSRMNNLPMEWWSGGAKVVTIDSTTGISINTKDATWPTNAYTLNHDGTTYAGWYGIRNTGTNTLDVALLAGDWSGVGLNGSLATNNLILRSGGANTETANTILEAYSGAFYSQFKVSLLGTTPTAFLGSSVNTLTFDVAGDLKLGYSSGASIDTRGNFDLVLKRNGSTIVTLNGGITVAGAVAASAGLSGTTGTFSGALAAGNTTVTGTISASGSVMPGRGLSTGDAVVSIGYERSGNGNSSLDLVGDTTYTSYGVSLRRGNTGANANSGLYHRGTGSLLLYTFEAAPIIAYTGGYARMTIQSTGEVKADYGFFAKGEVGAISGYLGITSGTQGVSTGTGTIKMNGTTARNSTGFWKIYLPDGSTAYVPYFATVTG